MPIRRRKRRFVRAVRSYVGSGVMLGAGSTVVGQMPATAASAGVQSGFGTMGTMMSPIGSALGAGAVIGIMRGIKIKKRKRR